MPVDVKKKSVIIPCKRTSARDNGDNGGFLFTFFFQNLFSVSAYCFVYPLMFMNAHAEYEDVCARIYAKFLEYFDVTQGTVTH